MISKRVHLRIAKKLKNMGVLMDTKVFIYMRLISSLFLFLFLFFTVDYGYIVAPVFTILFYIMAEYIILDLGVKRYQQELERQALVFFPLFLIALKGTRNVKKAISCTTEIVDNELSFQFKKVLKNVNIGKSLDESLQLFRESLVSDVLINIITSIMEANRVGTSIDASVWMQLNYIQEREKKSILTKYK